MHAKITAKAAKIRKICRTYRVARLEVFGSAARDADFDPEKNARTFSSRFSCRFRPGFPTGFTRIYAPCRVGTVRGPDAVKQPQGSYFVYGNSVEIDAGLKPYVTTGHRQESRPDFMRQSKAYAPP
ncbi:MAG: hypothetical protein OXF74_07660 [Rhodobacteraceae bacterium]|nr:hypothetical protein [Paracoccaceae bacterium]